jgi:hypothetical protein
MTPKWLALALAVGIGGSGIVLLAQKKSRQEQEERRKEERIKELSRKLGKLAAMRAPSAEQRFLQARATALLARARELPAGSHEFDRLRRAVGDLLEAGEEILEARQGESVNADGDQEEAARRLERAYFRIQEGDYFARLSAEPDAGDYLAHSRRLYQEARRDYDARQWRKARKLAEACSEIIEALERLAQARVRIPEPPRIE